MLSLSLSLSSFQRASIGPELVSNGTFASDVSGWTQVQASVTWQSGRLRATANGTQAGRAAQAITCVVGGVYQFSADVAALSVAVAGTVAVSTSTLLGGAIASDNTSGVKTKSFQFTATATTHYVILDGVSTASGAYAEFDNVTVRRIA